MKPGLQDNTADRHANSSVSDEPGTSTPSSPICYYEPYSISDADRARNHHEAVTPLEEREP